MTVDEFLGFVAETRGFRIRWKNVPAGSTSSSYAISNRSARQSIETLSKGYKQRSVSPRPCCTTHRLLVLDEPTDGLDPNQKHEVREIIKQMAAEKTVILSTHILEEVEAICTRIIIISRAASWSTTRRQGSAPATAAPASTKSSTPSRKRTSRSRESANWKIENCCRLVPSSH